MPMTKGDTVTSAEGKETRGLEQATGSQRHITKGSTATAQTTTGKGDTAEGKAIRAPEQATGSLRQMAMNPVATTQTLTTKEDTETNAEGKAIRALEQATGVSLVRYMGKMVGGLRPLREELEAENSGVNIPAEIRWLGGTKVRARFQKYEDGTVTAQTLALTHTRFPGAG